MPDRPSFLILITDQHRPDHTGFGGNDVLRTPHLDRLAARAMQFDRAIVANPICMPNRATIFTGRLPSVHGTRFNGIPLDRSANSFARVLRGEGYQTGYFGKLHLQNMGNNRRISDRIWQGTPEHNAREPGYEPGWDEYEDWERHTQERVEIPPDFYGLDEVELAVDHADTCGGHYYQWLLEQGADPAKLCGPQNALPFEASTQQIWRTRLPEEFYPTNYVSQRTCAFLERQASAPDVPFLAFCSYPDPHHPFTPPGRYFEMYDPNQIPLPETFEDPHTLSMPHLRRLCAKRGEQGFPISPFSPTERQYRQMAAAEYGAISMIDDGIGEVLATLERTGLAESTVVVFTSDHGDMFGDHGLMLKAGMHYQGCLRVPLLIARPGSQPGRTPALVSSLDLAQTVLQLAGAPEYHGMQGVSLVPLLEDPDESLRDHVLVEEDQMFDIAGIGEQLRMRTLITDQHRLTLYHGSTDGELFDLGQDPDELRNGFGQREQRATRAALAEQLAHLQMEYADRSPRPTAMA